MTDGVNCAQRFNTSFSNMQVVREGLLSVEINESGDLIATYKNGSTVDIGHVVGRDGVDGRDGADGRDGIDGSDGRDGTDGFSPSVTLDHQSEGVYVLKVTNKNSSYLTPNLIGPKGDKGDKGDKGGIFPKLIVTVPTGSSVVCYNDDTVVPGISENDVWIFRPDDFGAWTLRSVRGEDVSQVVVNIDAVKEYNITMEYDKVFGVMWDKTSSSALSRTDDAEPFVDPVPYYSGMSGTPSSPFDNYAPWNQMVEYDDPVCGKLVVIPKFWYKLENTSSSLTLKISSKPRSGFNVSPAHADRGDGHGERDVVYVGKYHCNNNYKSASGQSPVTGITRAEARTGISSVEDGAFQIDYATLCTIRMLYLVEFADWNSQVSIGMGCGNNSSPYVSGYSDTIPYHTGTNAASRSSYAGTKYRNIEGLWDSVYDWTDGIYIGTNEVYLQTDPTTFSDSESGTLVCGRYGFAGYISDYNSSVANGFEWFIFPSETNGTNTTYVTDFMEYVSVGDIVYSGGCYTHSTKHGMFFHGEDVNKNYSGTQFGCRLQKLEM